MGKAILGEQQSSICPCLLGLIACTGHCSHFITYCFYPVSCPGGETGEKKRNTLGDLCPKLCDGAVRRGNSQGRIFVCRGDFPSSNRRCRTSIGMVMGGCHREMKISKQACRNHLRDSSSSFMLGTWLRLINLSLLRI